MLEVQKYRKPTREFLENNGLTVNHLVMRVDGDSRKDIPNEIRVKSLNEIKLVFSDFTTEQLDYYEQICINKRVHFSGEKYLVDNVNTSDLLNYYRNNFNNYVTKRAKKLNK